MSQPIPYKDLTFSENSIDDVCKTSDDNDEGYMLEVDWVFPEHIHEQLK